MILYPDYYCKDVTQITPELLRNNNIKGLVLDIDNTLIDIDRKMLDGAKQWHDNILKEGFKSMILSNTNKIDKVEQVANTLNIEYINFAKKPAKSGFTKAKNKLKLEPENIAVIGDQIFTDVLGAKRSKMFAILVEPVDKRDFWYTKWKRPMENFIIKQYLKKIEKEGKAK